MFCGIIYHLVVIFLAYLNLPSIWKGNCFLVHWITNVTIFSRSVPLTVSDVNFLIWARRRRNSGPTEHMGQLGFLSPLDSNGGGAYYANKICLFPFDLKITAGTVHWGAGFFQRSWTCTGNSRDTPECVKALCATFYLFYSICSFYLLFCTF